VGVAVTRGGVTIRWKDIGRDVRGRFFTQRVVGAWNALSAVGVESDTLGTFERLLDRQMECTRMIGSRLV